MANILDGAKVSASILEGIKADVARLQAQTGEAPGLATVLVGEDPASRVYVKSKNETCQKLEMNSRHVHLPATATEAEVRSILAELNEDPAVSGILLQLPLPKGLPTESLLETIRPEKDVDGFHPYNLGQLVIGNPGLVPCTPAGIMEMLDAYEVPLAGKTAVVVGRSTIVGKPMGMLLLHRHATVVYCHSRTHDLAEVCRQADILVAAIGRPGLLTGDYVKEGAVVVDVGINRVTEEADLRRVVGDSEVHWKAFGKRGAALVGDVEWRTVAEKASLITPVPGGVGPLTIAMLMKNTLTAFRLQRNL